MARKRRSKRFGSSRKFFLEEQASGAPKKHSWRKVRTVSPSGRITGRLPGIELNKRACSELKGNPCGSKLVFLKTGDAKAAGTKAGANLLLCLGEMKPGPYIPVSSAAEATALGRKYCACRKDGGEAKKCAGGSGPLAGYLGRRGRSRKARR